MGSEGCYNFGVGRKRTQPMKQNFATDAYTIGAWLTGVLVFLGCWLYCVAEYGFFVGVCAGWIPSAIVGVVAGLLWPLVVLLVLLMVTYVMSHP